MPWSVTPAGANLAIPYIVTTVITPPVLLYDGLCGFCNGTVRFILERDKTRTMQFAALQGAYSTEIFKRHPSIQGIDSIVLVVNDGEREQLAIRSDAIFEIASYLGGVWRLARIARLVPRGFRDWMYDAFAKRRYRLFGRYDSCPLPDTDVRTRFLP